MLYGYPSAHLEGESSCTPFPFLYTAYRDPQLRWCEQGRRCLTEGIS